MKLGRTQSLSREFKKSSRINKTGALEAEE